MHLNGHHMATVDHGERSFGWADTAVTVCADALTRGDAVEDMGRDLRPTKKGGTPDVDKAHERLATHDKHGDSDLAFGGSYLDVARLFQVERRRPIAEELFP
ncbi:hypothetical protein [Celeribacter sp.]|uniref:hypothetical protein n=1 Tax=Celeribacter sp. TaxID=1890673 RepID=UPI003A8CF962